MLAWQLKTDENKQIINSIDTGNNITYNPIEINSTSREFYKEPYSSQVSDDMSQMEKCITTVDLPSLTEENNYSLDRPFSITELNEAIQSLPSNKSPGEDGFPPEF